MNKRFFKTTLLRLFLFELFLYFFLVFPPSSEAKDWWSDESFLLEFGGATLIDESTGKVYSTPANTKYFSDRTYDAKI